MVKVISKSYISKKVAVALAGTAALITGLVMMPQTSAQTACVSKSIDSIQHSYTETGLRDFLKTNCVNITYGGAPVSTSTPASSTTTPTPTPPAPTPTPPAPTPTPPAPSTKPSVLLGDKWTVMAPFNKVGATDSPENLPIVQAEQDSRYTPVMYAENGGITFKATAGGVHSANSKYPRTELREMKDNAWTEASWSNTSGTHTLEGQVSVNHNFVARPQMVFAQIHDASDDVLELAVDSGNVVLFYNDKATVVNLGAYVPNQKMTYKLVAAGSKVEVWFNGVKKADVPKSGSGWYFKTGAYLQTNVADWAEASSAYGATTIYSVKVTHL